MGMFNLNRNDEKKDMGLIVPLLPYRDVVVFPHMIVPLFVGRDRSISALESAMK
ncbi:MAG: LON peptidase substrate-binding domain-containing protein, partial [Syntrophales bacterium]|nr:LON peptidase substrate-binding domain-containing protein [Syntrophales bacterium]